MSIIYNRLLTLRRISREAFSLDARINSNGHYGFRHLSTGSDQGDDKDSKIFEEKLEKVAKKIGRKIGGEEGKKTKDSLMKMVSLQSEESKDPSPKVMANIASILKDLPVEVSKKMSTGMERRSDNKLRQDKQENRPWRDRPPKLDFRKQVSDGNRRDSYSHERARRPHERVNYYSTKPLNLFDVRPTDGDYLTLETWKRLREEEMNLEFRQPARNAFDEMIQLTEEGKLWSYPIDNEAGLDEEAKVPFYEHVLLDHLLEGMPESGPVREFMDFMVTGVSSNPYISVERKHATIQWYVDFFKEKEPILRECGAL